MKKEKKTKQKKTKKYKIWFVILVVPILLSVLPITTYALFNVNINNNYLSSVTYTSSGLGYVQQNYTNDDTSIQFTLSRNAEAVAITYNYGSITTEPITHINASFEVKNTENGTPIKRLSNITPNCNGYQLSGNTAEVVKYNLSITEYVNRYKYSIDSDVDIGIEQLPTVQFQFNIDSQSGTIDINYISITLTFGQNQEQVTVDLSGIESQLDNINEQISGISNDTDYLGINNVSYLRVYGVRNNINNSPSFYRIEDYTIEDERIKFSTVYTTYQEWLRFNFETTEIKTIQVSVKANIHSGDTILRTLSEYNPGIYYTVSFPSLNTVYETINYSYINESEIYVNYTYENSNVNKTTNVLWLGINLQGVGTTSIFNIWDIKIKINDIEYQVKVSGKNAENAVSEYESIIDDIMPDENDIESIVDQQLEIISEYINGDNIVINNTLQYPWFTTSVYNLIIISTIVTISLCFMIISFLIFGKVR